jgi:hypothetical protein
MIVNQSIAEGNHMINGAHFLLYSADPEADQAALEDILASRSVPAREGRLIFALPPAEIATHPGGEVFKQQHANRNLQGLILYLICNDLPSSIEALKEKGLAFSAIENTEVGLKTTIILPGGGELGLYQPSHEMAIDPAPASK